MQYAVYLKSGKCLIVTVTENDLIEEYQKIVQSSNDDENPLSQYVLQTKNEQRTILVINASEIAAIGIK